MELSGGSEIWVAKFLVHTLVWFVIIKTGEIVILLSFDVLKNHGRPGSMVDLTA